MKTENANGSNYKDEGSPLVTVAIVFYDAMPHFPLAVCSVLEQSFTNFELILIDDGSRDGSVDYAKSILDKRVRVYSDGLNRKLNFRLNQSVVLARGKYYFRMDADDVMFPTRIADQLEILQRCGDDVVVGSAAICINQAGFVTGLRVARRHPKGAYEARHAFVHPTVAASTAWFRNNPYSEDFVFHRSQDAELWTRTFHSSHFINISRPLLFYRDAGTIKLESYIGSSLGMLLIASRYRKFTKLGAALWASAELGKCWLVALSSIFGFSGLLRRARDKDMEFGAMQEGRLLLAGLAARAKAHRQAWVDSREAAGLHGD